MSQPLPASFTAIAKTIDMQQSSHNKFPRRMSCVLTSLSHKAVLVAVKPIVAEAMLAYESAGRQQPAIDNNLAIPQKIRRAEGS